jgi:signal transduction histidine kinase/ligand-binding sensor domain-containing protein
MNIAVNRNENNWLTSDMRRGASYALLALALLVALSAPAAAIDPTRTLGQSMQRIWQMQQGLPRAAILSILQSDSGYLWLGTQEGLVRFDGVQFTTLRDVDGVALEKLWVQDLHEDASHNLWVATDGAGLIRLRGATAKHYTQADGLPSDDIRQTVSDPKGNLWIATADGLARLDTVADRITVFRSPQGPATNDLRALCFADDGALWIGGDGNRITIFSDAKFALRGIASLPADGSVRALLRAPDGTVWAGTSDGLVRFGEGDDQLFTTAQGLAHDSVLCLAAGRNGTLWAGTKEGFSRFHDGEIDSFNTRDGLSQSTVYAVCEDREGSLWVGTKHGLNQFIDRRTIPFTSKEGLPSNDAGPVLQDAAGIIWVGTLGAGLAHFDGRRFSVLTTEDGLASNTIWTLAAGDDGDLWIGTTAGLNRLRDGRIVETFTTERGLPSNFVRCLCRDRKGTLWVGTAAGLAVGQGERFVQPPGDPGTPIRALVDHQSGAVPSGEQPAVEIVAAIEGGGLCRATTDRLESFTTTGSIPRDVDTFFEDADGWLWMGTQGAGLLLLRGEKLISLTTKDGLYDDDIFGIVADDQDRLWMACSKGIFFVSRSDLRRFAVRELKTVESTPFSPMDSLRTIECKGGVQPAVWKMDDGRIWFSTIRGLILIDPKRLERILPPLPVAVEEVIVNGKSEEPQQVASLPPGDTNLEFRYTALSFVAPTRITFRYRLDGFDSDWIEAGSRREAFYTNLSPGNYEFRVAARSVGGPWQEAATPLALTLEPYFYQTRWFMPLCGSLLVFSGWAAYRLRVRRIKEHLRLVLAERSRIARELHDTLMQGFSGVTMEMQALSARLAPSDERRTLEEIIRDAGICLREARRSVAGLRRAREGESGLSTAIEQAARQLTETHDLRLKLELERSPPGLSDEVQYNLLRIAQEAVNNAVKHSGCRNIEVGLACTPARLRLSIGDDGVGFGTLDGNRPQPGHYGLIGMRERATQIGATIDVDSQPGRGTRICVSLPIAENGAAPEAASIAKTNTAKNSAVGR